MQSGLCNGCGEVSRIPDDPNPDGHKGSSRTTSAGSAVRNLINAGVDQAAAMKITGHRTILVFLRYNIISTDQLHEAMEMVTSKKTATK